MRRWQSNGPCGTTKPVRPSCWRNPAFVPHAASHLRRRGYYRHVFDHKPAWQRRKIQLAPPSPAPDEQTPMRRLLCMSYSFISISRGASKIAPPIQTGSEKDDQTMTRLLFRISALVLMVASVVACKSVERTIYTREQLQTMIEVGSSQVSVSSIFGRPDSKSDTPDGTTIWTYHYSTPELVDYRRTGGIIDLGGFEVAFKDGKVVRWFPILTRLESRPPLLQR